MNSDIINEFKRKAIHFLGVLWVFASYYATTWQLIALLVISVFIIVVNATFFKHLIKIPLIGKMAAFWRTLARKEELSAKFYFGAVYFFASLAVILFLTHNLQIFRAVALILIFADGFSAIFGKLFGKTKLPYNKSKSLEGSIAGFLAAFIAVIFVLPVSLAISAAIAGTLIESLPWKLNDNLTITLGVGFLLWLLL